MPDKVFIDSNIWLYALIQSQNDHEKRLKAKSCIVEANGIIVSTQVINEVCINLMRKANKDNAYIKHFLSDFVVTYSVLAQTQEDVLQAASIREDYHFSHWDSLIHAYPVVSQNIYLLHNSASTELCMCRTLEHWAKT